MQYYFFCLYLEKWGLIPLAFLLCVCLRIVESFVGIFGGALFVVYFGPIVMNYYSADKRAMVNGINAAAYNVGSILAIIVILFGLNYFISQKNKNNTEVVDKVANNQTTMGDPDSKVKIVAYSDFQCPACYTERTGTCSLRSQRGTRCRRHGLGHL